jgi:peptidoglycan/LPS O-acetylase OafA/YrhL
MALYEGGIEHRLKKVAPLAIYLSVIAVFGLHRLPVSAVGTALNMIFLGPLIGMVLFYTSHFPCAARDVLSLPAVRFAGRISYGVYLWQQLATGYYEGAGVLFYGCTLTLAAIICIISFRYIEQPLIRLGARLSEVQIARELAGRFAPANAGQIGG